MADIELFKSMMDSIDESIIDTLNGGSANIISAITPLVGVCLSLYIMFICFSYWNGDGDLPVMDFFRRLVGWGIALTFGLNIDVYASVVAPFFNGLGDDLSRAINSDVTNANMLDSALNQIFGLIGEIWEKASGIEATLLACLAVLLISVFAFPFLAIAAAFITLAKLALAILLAIGPLFIVCAIFPPTRSYFTAWTAQCTNYVFLTLLINLCITIELNFMTTAFGNMESGIFSIIVKMIILGVGFTIILFQLPSLASALAGGVGISAMIGNTKNTIAGIGGSLGKGGGMIGKGIGKMTGGGNNNIKAG